MDLSYIFDDLKDNVERVTKERNVEKDAEVNGFLGNTEVGNILKITEILLKEIDSGFKSGFVQQDLIHIIVQNVLVLYVYHQLTKGPF